MTHKFTKIILLLILIFTAQSINILLHQPATQLQSPKRCYTSTVYKQQRLLIQIQLPKLKPGIQPILEVGLRNTQQNNQPKIIFTTTIRQAKYKKTIEKQSHNINELNPDHSLEYQTCIYLKAKSLITTEPKTDFQPFLPAFIFSQQQKKKNTQTYLISLKLLTNFSHVLQDKRSQSSPKPSTHTYTKEHLQILQERSNKLLAIAKQQVKIHRENERTEMKTEEHVKALENSIYSMSLLQSGLLVFGSLMHINLMRSYLKGSGLI